MKAFFFVILFLLSACEGNEEFKVEATTQEKSIAMEKWSRSCVLCHVNGEGGAPIVGDKDDWGPRLNQGKATLLQHTLEGTGKMPPLGYCMDCTERDYLVMIDFMADQ